MSTNPRTILVAVACRTRRAPGTSATWPARRRRRHLRAAPPPARRDDVLWSRGTDEHARRSTGREERGLDAEGASSRDRRGERRAHLPRPRDLGLAYDLFIRTTTSEHAKVVQDFFARIYGRTATSIEARLLSASIALGPRRFTATSRTSSSRRCPEPRRPVRRGASTPLSWFTRARGSSGALLEFYDEPPLLRSAAVRGSLHEDRAAAHWRRTCAVLARTSASAEAERRARLGRADPVGPRLEPGDAVGLGRRSSSATSGALDVGANRGEPDLRDVRWPGRAALHRQGQHRAPHCVHLALDAARTRRRRLRRRRGSSFAHGVVASDS